MAAGRLLRLLGRRRELSVGPCDEPSGTALPLLGLAVVPRARRNHRRLQERRPPAGEFQRREPRQRLEIQWDLPRSARLLEGPVGPHSVAIPELRQPAGSTWLPCLEGPRLLRLKSLRRRPV